MIETELYNDLKNQFVTFSNEIDSQIKKLQERGLVLPEEIERIKHSTEVYKEYLSRALNEPSLDLVKQQLLQTYFNDYKQNMTKTINGWWGRLYSDDNFKNQLQENLDQCYASLATQLSEQEVQQLIHKLAEIENNLGNQFKNELKKQGEINRYKIGDKIIAQSLPTILSQIEEFYSRKMLPPVTSNQQNANNQSFSQGNQPLRPRQSNQKKNKFDLFEKLGRNIDDVINNSFRSNS
jgi:hypothetical protein